MQLQVIAQALERQRGISARSRASWSDAEHIDEINARCDL